MSVRTVIVKLLGEVDDDIREEMLTVDGDCEKWQLLPDPANTILGWQYMRDYKGTNDKTQGR